MSRRRVSHRRWLRQPSEPYRGTGYLRPKHSRPEQHDARLSPRLRSRLPRLRLGAEQPWEAEQPGRRAFEPTLPSRRSAHLANGRCDIARFQVVAGRLPVTERKDVSPGLATIQPGSQRFAQRLGPAERFAPRLAIDAIQEWPWDRQVDRCCLHIVILYNPCMVRQCGVTRSCREFHESLIARRLAVP